MRKNNEHKIYFNNFEIFSAQSITLIEEVCVLNVELHVKILMHWKQKAMLWLGFIRVIVIFLLLLLK